MKSIFIFICTLFSLNLYSQQDYFIFLNTNPDKEELSEERVNELHGQHLANIDRLYKEGVITAVGPFVGGGGIFIIHAPDEETVWKHLKTDPAIRANRFNMEVHPMIIKSGKIYKIGDVYEMKQFAFARFKFEKPKNLPLKKDYTKDKHLKYMQSTSVADSLVLTSYFEDTRELVMIFNISDNMKLEEVLKSHPLSKDQLMTYELKRLWIAKESFINE
ncbi:MAG: hypothetical protein JEZ03_08035 [Bacteroidales bacterium]|nr:hypothetical protein [Bacteroidales bacterium]